MIPLLYNLSLVNYSLEALDISSIPESKVQNCKEVNKKIEEVGQKVRELLKIEAPTKGTGERVLKLFTEKFENLNLPDQYRILTSMPSEESREYLENTFGISERQARRAKQLQTEHGILSTPNPKPGKRIPEDTIEIVQKFYEKDTISRQMPGKRDCVSMVLNGKKEKVQERQILCTIYEAYLKFKEDFPGLKIGFSKFAEARQKNVVLPGSTGTHVVCVCTHHQNPKLMIANSQIESKIEFKQLIGEDYSGIVSYKHLLAKLMCNPPTQAGMNIILLKCSKNNIVLNRYITLNFTTKILLDVHKFFIFTPVLRLAGFGNASCVRSHRV